MIPLKDNVPSLKFPFVNYLLILANVAVFVYEVSAKVNLLVIIREYAFTAADFTANFSRSPFAWQTYAPLFTSLFFHGGLVHLLFNMLYLYIFGDNIEDKMGHLKYLIFYLLCGAAASLAQYSIAIHRATPLIGASGAISGVLAAYLVLFLYSRVLTLAPIVFILVIPIPAFFYILLWIVLQIINAVSSLFYPTGNVAWMAHVGGFLGGLLLYHLFVPKKRKEKVNYL